MQAFAHNQEQFRDSLQAAFGGFFPFGPQLEEASKRNLSLFQNAMTQLWAPFGQAPPADQGETPPQDPAAAATPSEAATPTASAGTTTAGPAPAPSLQDLQRQMEEIQRQLAALTKR